MLILPLRDVGKRLGPRYYSSDFPFIHLNLQQPISRYDIFVNRSAQIDAAIMYYFFIITRYILSTRTILLC